MTDLAAQLEGAYPRALATLIRLLGDFDSAEDMLQEAVARALEVWPRAGLPRNPVAWLVTTGRRRAIDIFRHQQVERRHASSLPAPGRLHDAPGPDDDDDQPFEDDLLRLIFTCCHPALAEEARVALTLKTVAGLSVDEIARAFLVTPKTMEQRLTRAKRKIREARIPYEVPHALRLPERLSAVLAVVYLIFNEGYAASSGPTLMRRELCEEAIRLGRLLARLFRGEPEVSGLLALMLLQHSRWRARTDEQGSIVVLDQQDRALWIAPLMAEGRALLDVALRHQRPGPYQIQAAIAAVHSRAARAEQTDWDEIVQLYHLLEHHQPSPVVALNRVLATARAQGVEKGLAPLEALAASPELRRYAHFHAARGTLLQEAGQAAGARQAYQRALELTRNPGEVALIQQKLSALP